MAQLKPAEGGIFWRTSKADVAHELALPPQSHRTTFLTLSAIERHFYMRQHQANTLLHAVSCPALAIYRVISSIDAPPLQIVLVMVA